jgi:hypothetical protein
MFDVDRSKMLANKIQIRSVNIDYLYLEFLDEPNGLELSCDPDEKKV